MALGIMLPPGSGGQHYQCQDKTLDHFNDNNSVGSRVNFVIRPSRMLKAFCPAGNLSRSLPILIKESHKVNARYLSFSTLVAEY